MSNNTTIILLWLGWSNIKLFEQIRPGLASIKPHFDSMMTLLICFWPSSSVYPSNTDSCSRWEEKTRSDSYCTKGAAKTTSPDTWDWLIMSVLAQTWGCSHTNSALWLSLLSSQYPSASTSHTYRHTPSLLH